MRSAPFCNSFTGLTIFPAEGIRDLYRGESDDRLSPRKVDIRCCRGPSGCLLCNPLQQFFINPVFLCSKYRTEQKLAIRICEHHMIGLTYLCRSNRLKKDIYIMRHEDDSDRLPPFDDRYCDIKGLVSKLL